MMMKRTALTLGISTAALLASLAIEKDAAACGGCFGPPPPPNQTASDITDERMLLTVSPQQTTLYDQIKYSGNPASFAWVLPIKGTVDVGLSADVLFDSVDAITQTTIQAPPTNCPPPPNCNSIGLGGASNSAFAAGEDATGSGGVTVTKQENVGPYDTVQLHSTTPNALENWLAQNGFLIPDDTKPVIAQYEAEGFDFLAMKLLPNQGVQSMRPVRVTMQGASLSLPLRMASVGTGASVGITIWVVSDGRYEPQNFPSFHIDDKDLVWDFSNNQSNYTTLRQQKAAPFNGAGWEIESSLDVAEQTVKNTILAGGTYYGPNYYGGYAGPNNFNSNASDDYLPVTTSMDSDGGAEGGVPAVTQTADQVRDADIQTLFTGLAGPNVRITRMRSDISHAAMNVDFLLQASGDQSELSNLRTVSQSVNLTCPTYKGCGILGGCESTPTPPTGAGIFAALLGIAGLIAVRMFGLRKSRNA
jgi:hypothetical protein